KAIFYLGNIIFLLLAIRATRGREAWVAASVGSTLVPFATELTCYYYSVLTVLCFTWIEDRSVGVIMALLACLSYAIYQIWPEYDQHCTYISMAVLLALIVIVLQLGRRESRA